MIRLAASALLTGIALVSAPAGARPLSSEECAVWNRELSFAQSVDNHDAAAFASHIQPGAVFSAATADVVRGRDAVVRNWAGIIEGKAITLMWRPEHVSIADNPNVAISRGPFYIAAQGKDGQIHYSIGTFTSVWSRSGEASPWQVLFDGGGPPPTPVATREEAEAHVAKAPQRCT